MENYGPITHVTWDHLGQINLVIGGNGTGKTTILKAIYSAIRALEGFQRGDDDTPLKTLLADKLQNVFQPSKLTDLVTIGAQEDLSFTLGTIPRGEQTPHELSYAVPCNPSKSNSFLPFEMKCNLTQSRQADSIFLPAKEVLSLHKIILKSRFQDKLFGFDDTYLDLAVALITSSQRGKSHQAFSVACQDLAEIIAGKVAYDDETGRWYFSQGQSRYPIGMTAEGVKKMGILDTLLSNRYLTPNSVVFMDEPEAALHPSAISRLMEIVATLAMVKNGKGIQFFMASHSYYVIKKLYLIAQQQQISIPILHEAGGQWQQSDLLDGMPSNRIIDESVQLYREEVDLAL